MFRYWHGPVVGLRLTHIWEGYAARIFLQFGELLPARRPDGSPGEPKGEFGLMNAMSWSGWQLSRGSTRLVNSDSAWPSRERVLKRLLIGRRLRSLEIDAPTR